MQPQFRLSQTQTTILLIAIAFIFSLGVRMIWVGHFGGAEQFEHNGQLMINTNDGYYWAEGARDLLAGGHQEGDLSPVDKAASQLTAVFAKVLPFSFESVILYMPAFLSSLVVIPLVLIGKSFGRLDLGFVAALIGSIAWSYYNRTMVGYYDTDMLNIVFPTFLLWSLIYAIRTREEKYLLITGIEIIAYRWWYPQSYALEFAFFILIGVYTLYLVYKKKDFTYELKLLSTVLVAMVYLHESIRLLLVGGLYYAARQARYDRYFSYVLGAAAVVFLATGGVDPIWGKLKHYVFRDEVSAGQEGLKLSFFTVMQTVREAGAIPFETFANRISGHTVTLLLSLGGYAWFVYKHKAMLLALPMLGLGFLAYGLPGVIDGGGLRFTIYAVPVAALGAAYLIVKLSDYTDKAPVKYGLIFALTLGALYPNIKHAQQYLVPTVFNSSEVQVLEQLGQKADRQDYVLAWWDYGYPIRYYSDVKTLVDGGKHSGKVNFPVSYALTNPQPQAAKVGLLDVYYTEQKLQFKLQNPGVKSSEPNTTIEQMTTDYGFDDTNKFLLSLQNDTKLPKMQRDVYFYLPHRMLSILPTVTLFSNLDLMSGQKYKRPFFYQSKRFKEEGSALNLGGGVKLLQDKGKIVIGEKKVGVNRFVVTAYDDKQNLHTRVQTIDENAPLYVIYMKSYNTFLVMDKQLYDSAYIQLFVLENVNTNYFEPVIKHPLGKVYRVKKENM